jgi:hypothetical protein
MSLGAKEVRLTYFLIALFYLLVVCSNINAQGYVDLLPDEIKNPFYERRGRVVKELSGATPEWVGQYTRYIGETWSEVLWWGPQNGFAAFRDTCSNGPRAWVTYGEASLRGEVLVFDPERDEQAEHALKLQSNEFRPVKWGEQHWLVPTDQLALFAYAVNSRAWEEYESFYIKTDDIKKTRKGLPNLPPEYKKIIGRPPIKAAVIEVKSSQPNDYPKLEIDAGKNKLIIKGMSFWLVGGKNITVKVMVTEVRERTSVVEIISVGIQGGETIEIVPKRGWRFSSRYSG